MVNAYDSKEKNLFLVNNDHKGISSFSWCNIRCFESQEQVNTEGNAILNKTKIYSNFTISWVLLLPSPSPSARIFTSCNEYLAGITSLGGFEMETKGAVLL